MTTFRAPSMLSELAAGEPIPLEKRAYFHARVLNSFYQFVLQKFLAEERAGRLTKAELARRIERRPEVVSRLLGAPGNWGLETATDLLLGIAGEELKPASAPLLGRPPRNYDHAEWLRTSKAGTVNAVSRLMFEPQKFGHSTEMKVEVQRQAQSTPSPVLEKVEMNASV